MESLEIRELFVKSLLFGIYQKQLGSQLDLFFTALLNDVEVEPTTSIPTAAATLHKVHYKILVNIENFAQSFPGLTQQELVTLYRAVVKHELMHIYLGHLLLPDILRFDPVKLKSKVRVRFDIDTTTDVVIDTRDPRFRQLFNVAADAIINEMIDEFEKLRQTGKIGLAKAEEFVFGKLPKEVPTFCYGSDIMKDCSAEELAVVLWLLVQSNNTSQKSSSQSSGSSGGANGSQQPRQSQGNQQTAGGSGNASNGDKGNDDAAQPNETQPEFGEDVIGRDINYVPEQAREVAKEVWRDVARKAGEHAGQGLGRMHSDLQKFLERRGKINWRQQLRAGLWSEVSEQIGVSKHRLNRRTDIPPKLVHRPAPKVVAFVDTSGSVSDALLDAFVAELARMRRDSEGEIIVVTYSVGATHMRLKRRTDSIQITERGGTDLANALQETPRKLLANADVVVIFTDGFDSFPEEHIAKIPARKIFVFPERHDQAFAAQAARFGKIIIIEA